MQIRTNYFSRWRLITVGYCSWVLDTTPQVWLSAFLLGIPVLVDGGGGGGEGGFSLNGTGQSPVRGHDSGNQNRHPTNSVVIYIMIA